MMEELLEITLQLAETREIDALLDKAVMTALEVFDAERGYVILLEDGDMDFRVHRHQDGSPIPEPELQISRTLVQRVIDKGEGLVVADAQEHPDLKKANSVSTLNIRSVICVPLRTRYHLHGVIYLESRSTASVFYDEDIPPLQMFANHAAVAIENALLNAELEKQVTARTKGLSYANERLAQIIDELDAFAETVAHDLKRPLGVLYGYANLLLDAQLTEEERYDFANKIVVTAERMEDIINSLLMLASSHADVEILPVNMAMCVDVALSELEPLILNRGAHITQPDAWPRVLGYGQWVTAVWANYISNAIKYGGEPPRIELGATAANDDMVQFWVSDNGIGLTPEQQTQLFTPFVRLDHTNSDGHGLGLSIVRRIVERLGGKVGVTSQPGEGSVFSFTLPRA
ncbi:MAG: GAF domain-containing sensor histidine kinase [Chloroflexi bacterium]|nr:GAF domain-containing sensor histidine kinase [Chloroflexota bacterium]